MTQLLTPYTPTLWQWSIAASEDTQLSHYWRHNHDSLQFSTWLLCLQRYAIGQAGGDRAVPAGGHSRAVWRRRHPTGIRGRKLTSFTSGWPAGKTVRYNRLSYEQHFKTWNRNVTLHRQPGVRYLLFRTRSCVIVHSHDRWIPRQQIHAFRV